MRHRRRGLTAAAAAVLFAAGCGTESDAPAPVTGAPMAKRLESFELGAVKRIHRFDGIFLASQPTPEDLERAKELGVRTVINQRPESEMKDFDERAVVTSLGMVYANPGWNGPEALTDEIIDETRALLRTSDGPILMHCASANRSGAIWLAYRVLDDGIDVEDAVVEAKTVGLRTPEYEPIIRDYIARRQQQP